MADGGGGEEGNASAHKGSSRRRGAAQVALDADELLTLMHGSDPVKVELNRLENEVRGELFIRASHSQRSYGILLCIWWIFASLFFFESQSAMFGAFPVVPDKDRELGEAQVEIKALRLSERAREKAVEEVITQRAADLRIKRLLFCFGSSFRLISSLE
jgi:hypothetical protein